MLPTYKRVFHFFGYFSCIILAIILPLSSLASDRISLPFSNIYLNRAAARYGISAKRRLKNWATLLKNNRNRPEEEKLQIVNRFFNKIPYVSDYEHWNQPDYWATPAEMLASYGGDCEDYAIAKYFTLVTLNVDPNKLKITYVMARTDHTILTHMVLAYYPRPQAIPLVLDNLIKQILPANKRSDLTPVYAFNGEGLWTSKPQNSQRVGSSGKIRFWQEMRNRIGKEF